MQSRLGSFIESTSNVLLGLVVAILAQMVIFPLYGITTTFATNLQIALWFTVISIIRSYAVRRFFNYRITKKLQNR